MIVPLVAAIVLLILGIIFSVLSSREKSRHTLRTFYIIAAIASFIGFVIAIIIFFMQWSKSRPTLPLEENMLTPETGAIL